MGYDSRPGFGARPSPATTPGRPEEQIPARTITAIRFARC